MFHLEFTRKAEDEEDVLEAGYEVSNILKLFSREDRIRILKIAESQVEGRRYANCKD